MLEVMGRLKNVKNLDSRRCAQVTGKQGDRRVRVVVDCPEPGLIV